MTCESAFTLTASSIIHLLPVFPTFKKRWNHLGLVQIKFKTPLYTTEPELLLSFTKKTVAAKLSVCPLSCLNYESWLLIIISCTQYLTLREIHIQGFFQEQCIWTLNGVKSSMRKFKHCGYWLDMVQTDQCEKFLNLRTLNGSSLY
jgi:hypothetical protein